ncbi:MAG: polysaccharide deacetylase family protein [Flavobacteriales bacterium]
MGQKYGKHLYKSNPISSVKIKVPLIYLAKKESSNFENVYTTKTPEILKALASDLTWNKSREEKCVYLTFDDGPAAGVTDKILDILHQFSAKATFFCVGEMVEKNPELLHRIKEEGHALGNHTYKHESGWKTENAAYFRSYLACHDLVDSKLFRPPYGRISKSQAKLIKKRSEIIMWDVLPGDFDQRVSAATCVKRIKANTKNGSIIVLHDNPKFKEKVLEVLPVALEWLTSEGYELKGL